MMDSARTLGRNWRATPTERARAYPCDGWLRDPDDVLFRAIDVAAPPAVVFRWLCQLRAAPYSYDWIDNWGRRSPRELTPGLDRIEVGQTVASIFRLVEVERDRHLTMVLERAKRVFGAIAITYEVVPAGRGSRLLVKILVRRPGGLFGLVAPLLPAADLVMMRKQLLTLRHLAERTDPTALAPERAPGERA